MIDPHQSHEDREKEADKRHRCAVCGEWKVIPTLARGCEKRHAAEMLALGIVRDGA